MKGGIGQYPELGDFVATVERAYGRRLDGVYLFGSRARGDHRLESDYDVAVVLRDLTDFWMEKLWLADIAYEQMLAAGIHIQPHPFDIVDWSASDPASLARSARSSATELRA